jgi:hypothetical protein
MIRYFVILEVIWDEGGKIRPCSYPVPAEGALFTKIREWSSLIHCGASGGGASIKYF